MNNNIKTTLLLALTLTACGTANTVGADGVVHEQLAPGTLTCKGKLTCMYQAYNSPMASPCGDDDLLYTAVTADSGDTTVTVTGWVGSYVTLKTVYTADDKSVTAQSYAMGNADYSFKLSADHTKLAAECKEAGCGIRRSPDQWSFSCTEAQ